MPRRAKQPVFDNDNPEWTKADFAKATKFPEGVRLKDIKPDEIGRIVSRRGPQTTHTNVAVSIRLSPEVSSHFKAKGPGWQSRIDDALRKIARKAG
jgi:uncharacterized protein (DUF4415 family)